MKGSYQVHTLGCKVNTYESEAVSECLNKAGYHLDQHNNPDVIIINTCSVTSVSDQKSRQKIRSLIRQYPTAIVVVMGCYAQMAASFVSQIPGVAIVIGTQDRHRIPMLIEEYLQNHELINCVAPTTRLMPYEPLAISSYSDNTRAFLKIQDGCDNFCSYCIIPYSRGGMRSRHPDEVIAEAKRLVAQGFHEIVLTGIHTGGYGSDLKTNLAQLILRILREVSDLKRLRISSIEATEVDDELISLLVNEPRIAPHLHIPLQSGADQVLHAMNRKYDTAFFAERLRLIRRYLPRIAITTDIIVGFPGESEAAFQETYEFARACRFADIHVFPFSARQGTPAARRTDIVDSAIKKERVHRLIALKEQLIEEYQAQFVDEEVEVLFEEYDPSTGINRGVSGNYLRVEIRADRNLHNEIHRVKYHQKTKQCLK